jgi:hypothetical protein
VPVETGAGVGAGFETTGVGEEPEESRDGVEGVGDGMTVARRAVTLDIWVFGRTGDEEGEAVLVGDVRAVLARVDIEIGVDATDGRGTQYLRISEWMDIGLKLVV